MVYPYVERKLDKHWKNDFRMTRSTSLEIVRIAQPVREKRDTPLRREIPIEKLVAMALWWLSTRNSFWTTAETFAVGKSTAVQITRDFCSEVQRLASKFIKFPNTRRETAKAIEKFRILCRCQIPQTLGAWDSNRVPIIAPSVEGKPDY